MISSPLISRGGLPPYSQQNPRSRRIFAALEASEQIEGPVASNKAADQSETSAEQGTQRSSKEHSQIRADVSRKIRQFAKEGKLSAAVEAFTQMQVEGIAPDAMAATALIDCCVRCGELARGERAFFSLFSTAGTLRPDAVAVGVLLRAYGQRKPVAWAKIQQLLMRVESEFGMQPSVGVFNELVEICARENDVAKGIELLEKMAAVGVEPDGQTFEAVKRRRALRSHFKKLF